jgi:hypothetical protein
VALAQSRSRRASLSLPAHPREIIEVHTKSCRDAIGTEAFLERRDVTSTEKIENMFLGTDSVNMNPKKRVDDVVEEKSGRGQLEHKPPTEIAGMGWLTGVSLASLIVNPTPDEQQIQVVRGDQIGNEREVPKQHKMVRVRELANRPGFKLLPRRANFRQYLSYYRGHHSPQSNASERVGEIRVVNIHPKSTICNIPKTTDTIQMTRINFVISKGNK